MKQVNQGSNIYCGPAVLSIVSGKNTDECARVINKIRSKPSYTDVKEIYSETELPKALDMLGFDIDRVNIDEDSSLLWTLHMICNIEGMYIIQVPAHVVAVEVKDKRVYLCDNHTKEPINAANSARIGQRVAKVWSVRERPKAKTFKYRVYIRREVFASYVIETTSEVRGISDFNDPIIGNILKTLDKTEYVEQNGPTVYTDLVRFGDD